MRVAVTGATGFIGPYLLRQLVSSGHSCKAWVRPQKATKVSQMDEVEWVPGRLGDPQSTANLLDSCDAVIHAALDRPGTGFRGAEGDIVDFATQNVIGTLRLIETARRQGVGRFVFISTCAVHERILDDRPLDEAHPTWATSHYGAHKAAIENFVHSFGWGEGYPICALRPTGVYGMASPANHSKWFPLIQQVVRGETVSCQRGGKEVHAQDVARAAELLLTADGIAGESYNCYDRYVSEFEVASIAKELSASQATVQGESKSPKHQILTDKLQQLGMEFGGEKRLRKTVQQLVAAAAD